MSNYTLLPIPEQVLAASSPTRYLLVALLTFFAYVLASYVNSPLRPYPGPVLASRHSSHSVPPVEHPRLTTIIQNLPTFGDSTISIEAASNTICPVSTTNMGQ
jgi:hypothetical protein